ncbi:MAG: hypothetical protein FWD83_05315 [Promicromonosporaceae bacterium]|nr:hypothetical protein [Promicromonosporaceae bacterium]
MTNRRDTDPLIHLLSDLNPVSKEALTKTQRIRSQALLQRITAHAPTGKSAAANAGRRQTTLKIRALRWAAIPAATALAIGIGIAIPGSPLTPPAAASMHSWTPEPEQIEQTTLAMANRACNNALNNLDPGWPDGWPFEVDALPVVADLRGDWGLVVMEGLLRPGGGLVDASCLIWFETPDIPVVQRVTLDSQRGGVEQRPISAESSPQGNVTSGQRLNYQLISPLLPSASASESRFIGAEEETTFSNLHGRVSDDVARLIVHTVTAGDVEATVTDGWFAVWWPGEWGDRQPLQYFDGTPWLDADGAEVIIGHQPALGITVITIGGESREIVLPAWGEGHGSISLQ